MNQKKLLEIKTLIEGAQVSLDQARDMLAPMLGEEDRSLVKKAESQGSSTEAVEGQIIEGVFDGTNMIGPDGKQYSVPANYASKSKLVEGDLLKLTIDTRGNFVYKQIGPIERARLKGVLSLDEKTEEWRVLADGKAFKVLLASVTYFKGVPGDEVVIMVPQDKSSSWAAVENIIKSIAPSPDAFAASAVVESHDSLHENPGRFGNINHEPASEQASPEQASEPAVEDKPVVSTEAAADDLDSLDTADEFDKI